MSEAVSPLSRPKGPRSGVIIALVSLIVVFMLASYAFRQRNAARDLSARNADLAASLQQTRAQVEAINTELNTLRSAPVEPAAASVAVKKPTPAKHVVHRRAEDARWKKVQAQLDEQGKAIDATRQDLASARTELSGSIAKTHDELVVLEKKGERNYFEFDLDKSKQFHRSGQVGVRLRKANVNHQYADLELLVGDAQLTKKHVNLYEPVLFYPEDQGRPVELVINTITKNHVHGYVSAPKYNAAALASDMPQPTPAQPSAPSAEKSTPALRQRN